MWISEAGSDFFRSDLSWPMRTKAANKCSVLFDAGCGSDLFRCDLRWPMLTGNRWQTNAEC
jgi:hypothetical protein